MKKAFILALTLTLSVSALAWGRLGHASIAKIAEDHLTKRTKRAISEIMQGEPISGYASYADEYRKHFSSMWASILPKEGIGFRNCLIF